jgi:hypothetical protein
VIPGNFKNPHHQKPRHQKNLRFCFGVNSTQVMEMFNKPVEVRAVTVQRELQTIAKHHEKRKWQWRTGFYGKAWDRHHKKIAEDCDSRVSFHEIWDS